MTIRKVQAADTTLPVCSGRATGELRVMHPKQASLSELRRGIAASETLMSPPARAEGSAKKTKKALAGKAVTPTPSIQYP
jgi:hypothetical protein